MSDLLPCPFCGDRLVQRHAGWLDHPIGDCVLSERAFPAFHKGWIGQWNKRADLPRPQDAARIAELEAENARLRAALEPFALEAAQWEERHDDERIVESFPCYHGETRVGDLRRARAALAADSAAAMSDTAPPLADIAGEAMALAGKFQQADSGAAE